MNGASPLRAETVTAADFQSALSGQTTLQVLSDSAEATRLLAAKVAAILHPGDVVLLFGELGAGKTTFVQGLCQALGTCEKITSPTFTLMHVYRSARCNVFHFDFYRLASVHEIAALGFEEYFEGEAICLIEWPERALPLLSGRALHVKLLQPDFQRQTAMRIIEISRPVS
jgi:tRNA threonylcarbamoyladenosine biosynthesis protein TsaE